MGSVLPYVSTALSAKQTADHSKEIDLKNKQLAANADAEKQKNLLDLKKSETARQSKLRAALSTQRANFGAQGVGAGSGSSEAVLQGIFEDSDIERQENAAETEAENKAIDSHLSTQTQLNLLQKQQLKQKSVLGILTDIF